MKTHKTLQVRIARLRQKPDCLKGLRYIQYFADYAKYWGSADALDAMRFYKFRQTLKNPA